MRLSLVVMVEASVEGVHLVIMKHSERIVGHSEVVPMQHPPGRQAPASTGQTGIDDRNAVGMIAVESQLK